MGTRVLGISIHVISAEVLRRGVNLFTPTMEPYVVVSVNGDHRSSQTTPIGTVRGSCCYWNNNVRFPVETTALSVEFHLKSRHRLEDVDIATFEIPIDGELFHGNNRNLIPIRSLVIDFFDGEVEGFFNFSYQYSNSYSNLVPLSVINYPPANPSPSPSPRIVGYLYPTPPPPHSGYLSYEYREPPSRGYGYDDFAADVDFEDYYLEAAYEDDFDNYFDDYYEDY
ncbi:hypothetical protein HRI_001623100 [Hibiscus trionum]|uniref:C2 domain-containing protein n=1 Tax=Hibiscus trionum TaxID=183268 RepID=A0A9W7HMM0_HIBTR|nr:hypothetical protein HRI_001623100 [Hibiscus trionum]